MTTHEMLVRVQCLLLFILYGSRLSDQRGLPLTTERLERMEAYLIRRFTR